MITMNRTSLLLTAAPIVLFSACGSDSTPAPTETGEVAGSNMQMQMGASGSGGGSGGNAQSGTGGMSGSNTTMMGGLDAAVDVGSPSSNDSGPMGDANATAFPKRVLLYHFSTLVIGSLPAQLTFLKAKLTEWGYENEDSVDPTKFTDDNLSRYAAVAMINT